MKVDVIGRRLTITDGIKDHVFDRVQRLEKMGVSVSEANMTLSVEKKHVHVAELVVMTSRGVAKGSATSDDMYLSIDKAVDKVSNHLEKERDRLKDHKAPSVRDVVGADSDESDEGDAEDEDEDEDIGIGLSMMDEPKGMPVRSIEVKPMDIQEAVMQYNLHKEDYFLFERVDTKKINLLIKNSRGELEVVEPLQA